MTYLSNSIAKQALLELRAQSVIPAIKFSFILFFPEVFALG
jgi:hypothetical protein